MTEPLRPASQPDPGREFPWTGSREPAWAKGIVVPSYLALREGSVPLVIVAPHGGRRRRALRPGDSVNDLHTAAMAWELADRLGAHAIVNHGLDRNDIDLNRISHLTAKAPEVLALLAAAVEAASKDGRIPLILFVHGWNMVVPCCDIGIGLRRRSGVLSGRHPTLRRVRYDGAIAAIERELGVRGLSCAIGRRYAASGRDNAAQLFSGRHAGHDDAGVAALARLANDGRADAAQLELGIPLRWPGPAREALIDGLVAGLQAERETGGASLAESGPDRAAAGSANGWQLPPSRDEAGEPGVEAGFSLQAVLDADGRFALFCGVEATSPRSMTARFCLVDSAGSMALLVGEGEWKGDAGCYDLEGFEWRRHGDGAGVDLKLHASLVRYHTHDAYLDLEQGLSGSELVDGDVDLRFEAESPGHGSLRGTVNVGGQLLAVDTTAFVDRGSRRDGHGQDRLRLLVARGSGDVVVLRGDEAALEMTTDGALGSIRVVEGRDRPQGLHGADIMARVPVWRPGGDGVFLRWTFGIVSCRFLGDGEAKPGLFDRLEVFRRPR